MVSKSGFGYVQSVSSRQRRLLSLRFSKKIDLECSRETLKVISYQGLCVIGLQRVGMSALGGRLFSQECRRAFEQTLVPCLWKVKSCAA